MGWGYFRIGPGGSWRSSLKSSLMNVDCTISRPPVYAANKLKSIGRDGDGNRQVFKLCQSLQAPFTPSLAQTRWNEAIGFQVLQC